MKIKKKLMKNFILLLILMGCISIAQSQHLKVPELSPFSKIEQMVGFTNIEIEYSRPSVKGRKVFGELVPYNELWRTGANLNTTITLSRDIKMNQQSIKKGSYAIFTIPVKNADWEVIIYDAPKGYTPQVLEDTKVVSRFKIPVSPTSNFVESFTIEIGNLKTSSANMFIKWANIVLDIPLEVNSDEMAMKNIESLMKGPSADDLFQAAEYYFFNDKDLNTALKWAKQSGEKYTWDAYWPHYLEAKILAKQKRYNEAIVAGKRAEQYVRKAGYLVDADIILKKLEYWKNKQ